MIRTKKLQFDAAHSLPDYDGKCANLHGHTYFVEVSVVCTKLDETGRVIDPDKLEQIAKENAIDKLDHTTLNDLLEHPTAENIAMWIYEQLEPLFDAKAYQLHEIAVWETPKSFVRYRKSES